MKDTLPNEKITLATLAIQGSSKRAYPECRKHSKTERTVDELKTASATQEVQNAGA